MARRYRIICLTVRGGNSTHPNVQIGFQIERNCDVGNSLNRSCNFSNVFILLHFVVWNESLKQPGTIFLKNLKIILLNPSFVYCKQRKKSKYTGSNIWLRNEMNKANYTGGTLHLSSYRFVTTKISFLCHQIQKKIHLCDLLTPRESN
jgi:hypothetical protein